MKRRRKKKKFAEFLMENNFFIPIKMKTEVAAS
jgi:hypothetical protein